MIGKAIYNILSSNSGVNTIVSNRIFPVILPEGNTIPSIVYTVVDDQKSDTKEAAGSVAYGLLEVKCFAESYPTVQGLVEAVNTALAYSKGSFNGVTVQHISSAEVKDIFEEEPRSDGVFVKVADFKYFIEA